MIPIEKQRLINGPLKVFFSFGTSLVASFDSEALFQNPQTTTLIRKRDSTTSPSQVKQIDNF